MLTFMEKAALIIVVIAGITAFVEIIARIIKCQK